MTEETKDITDRLVQTANRIISKGATAVPTVYPPYDSENIINLLHEAANEIQNLRRELDILSTIYSARDSDY